MVDKVTGPVALGSHMLLKGEMDIRIDEHRKIFAEEL